MNEIKKNDNKKLKVGIYLRLSNEDKDKTNKNSDSESIKNQRNMLIDYINRHPIFTLISMYTGFKFIGIIGLLVGPIIFIVLKNIFENMIDDGIIKSILK